MYGIFTEDNISTNKFWKKICIHIFLTHITILQLFCYITDLEVEQILQNIVIVLKIKSICKYIIWHTKFLYIQNWIQNQNIFLFVILTFVHWHILVYLFELEGCSVFCFLEQNHLAKHQSNTEHILIAFESNAAVNLFSVDC